MSARVLRRSSAVLLVATMLALAWNQFGMNRSLVIDPASPFLLTSVDDRSTSGGRSVSGVSRTDQALGLDCQLAVGAARPFCEMRIEFAIAPAGIDLSGFDTLRLRLSATGPQAHERVRIYLRDFDPATSKPGLTESQKVDQLVYEPALHPPGHEVSLRQFGVAPWWIDDHSTALDIESPDFRNVTMLAFVTGPRAEPGLHRIRVERVELRGKLVAPATFRLGVLLAWMSAVGGGLAAQALSGRNRLRLSAASEESLQRLNESFRLETRSLAELARIDGLTGLLNRRGLANELTRLVRMGGDAVFPLTLVFIDIDHFKRLNDEHGRGVGDRVLRGLVELVRSTVQGDDLFARWGGEEFLVVLARMPGEEGKAVAERLRERIAGAQWPEGLRVTCSFGVAEWHRGEDLNDGVQRADEAMYRAKQNGRDRVELELETDAPVSVM